MIWIVWRGSGILVLIYFFLSAWLCTYYFDGSHNLNNSPYAGWTLFWAAIVTTIHALLIVLMYFGAKAEAEENPPAPPAPGEEPEPKPSMFRSHLFYIPVIFWPLIFGLLSAKFLIGSDNSYDPGDYAVPENIPQQEEVISRSINFLNSTEDTMYYEIGGSGAYEYKPIEPRTYITRTLDPGKYYINGYDAAGNLVFSFPSGDVAKDKSKSAIAKNKDGENVPMRIIGDATKTGDDYEDVWIVLNGERDMLMVDVTALCHDGVTRDEVNGIGWTKLTQTFDGTDIIEPLYGEDPGTGFFTVLATGEEIPEKAKKNERVYALFSCERGTEITDEYLAGRIANRCPDIPSE